MKITIIGAGLIVILLAVVYRASNAMAPQKQVMMDIPTPAPNQGKILGIAPVPQLDPMPSDDEMPQTYLGAIDLAYTAGARGLELDKTWKDLEPSAGVFNLDDFTLTPNSLSNGRDFAVLLNLQVINTVSRETPPDLQGKSFDSKEMKARFHALIDAIAPHMNQHYLYLSIGNEVDVYLSMHNEWTAYQAFYEDSVAYIHQVMPWIKVGVSSTFNGATANARAKVVALNVSSDVYIITYYPIEADFKVRSPDAPLTDFPKLLALAGTRPVVLQEVGYPTSTLLSSSEQQQADFVANIFKAWGASGDKIPWLNYYMLHDLPAQICDSLSQYYQQPNSENFKAYLCSLGLRKANGSPKAGWQLFLDGGAEYGPPFKAAP